MSIATIIPYMILQLIFSKNTSGIQIAKMIVSIIYPPQAFYEATSVLCTALYEEPLTASTMFSFKRKFIVYILINFAQGIVFMAIVL